MKRFHLFGQYKNEHEGGMYDYAGAYDTADEAKESAAEFLGRSSSWAHIAEIQPDDRLKITEIYPEEEQGGKGKWELVDNYRRRMNFV